MFTPAIKNGRDYNNRERRFMSYEKFVGRVVEILGERVEAQVHLTVHTTIKNNGYERKGITFSEEGINISPTIYLEEYYEKFIRGSDVESLAEQVLKMYDKVRVKHIWGETAVQDYQNVKERIIYKLVNQERNEEMLSQVPHADFLDLAVLFYVLVDIDEPGGQMAAMLIRNEHLTWWKVTAEEIQRQAEANTERILPYEFSAMCMVIEEMLDDKDLDDEEWRKLREQESMYVLTNHIRSGGAAAILYPGRLEAIGAYFKENYYILPSSIHEVIIIPESRALPKEEMECVIREVNETQVQAEEFLSDHAYYYDRVKREITV